MNKILKVLILSVAVVECFSQESGRIFLRNFPPEEYKAADQNWIIQQDRQGIIYCRYFRLTKKYL